MQAIRLAFIGGGNMAGAIFGGLLAQGWPAGAIQVVEPWDEQRARLAAQHPGLVLHAEPDAALAAAGLVVWAVKPQLFAEAAAPCAAHAAGALHLSVMAGIRSDAIARAMDVAPAAAHIVRSMPNTPALIGRGIAGLFATPAVSADERALVEQVLAPTGQTLWVDRETDLDAVTALSGSGPAYVFYWVESMVAAAVEMGLTPEQGKRLALATFDGAAALAAQSDEPVGALRERVTSKGGTTHAAITVMEDAGMKAIVVRALQAARDRARELGR
jgi:pyrroline-5-carboxylate reductase